MNETNAVTLAHESKAPVAPPRDLSGTGYGRPAPTYNKELTPVGPGTPMGEYFRRYWQPVGISANVKSDPIKIKVLGEDLVLFRDGSGRAGVLFERCTHRQASLYFGRIEEDGIRCCYHGWKFDVEGRCLNQILENGGGKCAVVRQPWYPVEEVYGLIFVYMGPPNQIPLVPRYECMEPLQPGEYHAHAFDSMPGSTTHVLPTNWLIDQDNIHDMGHALWLHHMHSGAQFGPAFNYLTMENTAQHQNSYDYIETEHGIYSSVELTLHDGSVVENCLETHMPNVRFISPPIYVGATRLINWCVPVDDESHYTISLARVKADGLNMALSPMASWDRSDPEKVRRTPSDNEAQNSSGPIERHSEEHLVLSDRGVVKLRRQYSRELKAMAEGRSLMCVRTFGESPFLPVKAGTHIIKEAPEKAPAAPITAPTADSSGKWTLSMSTPMGTQTVTAALVQTGAVVSGTMTGPEGEALALFDGAVSGSQLSWAVNFTKPMVMKVAFTVTVDGDKLQGTFQAGPFPPSPVTGARQ